MLNTLHDGLGNAATLFALILALWGFVRYARGSGVGGDFLGAVAVAEGLIVAEVLVGFLLYANGHAVARIGIHVLYGITALISFPAFYAYSQGRDERLEQLLWALVAFFVWGLTIRARQVAGG